jgi:hypothetical protein
MTTKCKSCGAEIFWVKSSRGKPMPLNKDPDPAGNIVVVVGIGYVFLPNAPEALPPKPYYKSHFATCEFAAKHRKKETGKP